MGGNGRTNVKKKGVSSTDPKKVCLVISPCGNPGSPSRTLADDVCKMLILPAMHTLKLNPLRLDQLSPKGDINSNLVALLWSAPLCVCVLDLHNPNVMIETGIRLAYGKPIVFLKTRNTMVPFDINSQNSIEYDLSSKPNIRRSIEALSKHLITPQFHKKSAFSLNLDLIGAPYELKAVSIAKLQRLDRLIEDLKDFQRDLELDKELDARDKKNGLRLDVATKVNSSPLRTGCGTN